MVLATGSCSHIKSYHYFAHSIWARKDYVAFKCDSWEDYQNENCLDADSTYMGEHVDELCDFNFYILFLSSFLLKSICFFLFLVKPENTI